MAEAPVIQILEKDRHRNQHLVSLPNEVPHQPLTAPSSIRVRTRVLSLTANNLAYAKLGFMLGWWDVHPLPASTPKPFNDPTKYGRTNAWGFSEVLESTAVNVPKGSYLWGYQPLGTLPQDLVVREGPVPNQVFVTNENRQGGIIPFYNRYDLYPPSLKGEIESGSDEVARDASIKVMFETSFLLNRFAFAELAEHKVQLGSDTDKSWSKDGPDLRDTTIIVLAPGSKVALAFAHDAKSQRRNTKVERIIGAASDYSKAFVQGTNLYDDVVSTKASPLDVLSEHHVGKDEKIMLIDFGGRGSVGFRWAEEIKKSYHNFFNVPVAPDIAGESREEIMESFQRCAGSGAIIPNTSHSQARVIEIVGEKEYYESLNAAWSDLRRTGIKGMTFKWGHGMEDLKRGWEALCNESMAADTGYIYLL